MPHPIVLNPMTSLKRLGQAFAIAAIGVSPAALSADELDTTFSHTVGFERDAQLIGDGGTLSYAFVNTPFIHSSVQIVRPFEHGARLTFIAAAEASDLGNADRQDLLAGVSLAYQDTLGDENTLQFRITGEADRSMSTTGWSFQRERVSFRLQLRHSPEHTSIGRVRLGYRDQNEATFTGYDQREFLGEFTHMWRPNRDRLAVTGTIYSEARRADLDQYSYDETGLRLSLRVPISEQTEITARATYYQRDFLDGFSAFDPTVRADDRIKATVEFQHSFSDTMSGRVTAGWDENTSTISDRTFSGAVFEFGISYDLG